MTVVWAIDRALIAGFGVMSGLYKVGFGAADVALYAHLNLSPVQTAAVGAIQVVCGVGLWLAPVARVAAVGLTVCNTVATMALFAGNQQPFGWISFVFVAMAAALVFAPDRPARSNAVAPA